MHNFILVFFLVSFLNCSCAKVTAKDVEILKKCHSNTLNCKISNNHTQDEGEKELFGETSYKSLVKLNVGGKYYQTTLNTLGKINNSYFTDLFSKPWEIMLDDHGAIFIDRDGDLFRHVLSYLRTGKWCLPDDCHRKLLINEAKFYQLTDLLSTLTEPERKLEEEEKLKREKEEEEKLRREKEEKEKEKERIEEEWLRNPLFSNGTLLNSTHQIKLNQFYGVTNQKWQLLYKGTKDGFSALVFHTKCDNKGPTMTVIRSQKGYLFGGFTKESWVDVGGYKTDPTAFIFTLSNPHGIAATKFTVKDNGANAIYTLSIHGPTFGGGFDICNLISNYTNFPFSYTDTTGKGKTLFTGAMQFTTSDIEVYGLV